MRFSKEQKQEKDSRNQFNGFLDQHEWITADVYPDLGEDILVRIYDEGNSTGISFYVQLKSTEDIKNFRLKTGLISYCFEVKDLLHWESQVVPVLLVIWDVIQKKGWWGWTSQKISELDDKNPKWRKQKTTQVYFKYENEITEKSLKAIRFYLADYFFPNISKGKPFDIKTQFQFPKTPEGLAKAEELERSFKAGDQVEIDGEYISKVEFPNWFERLYGDIGENQQKIIFSPVMDKISKPAKIEFESPIYGLETIPFVDFRIEKGGNEEITLSNIQQDIPYRMKLVLFKDVNKMEFKINANYSNLDAFEAHKTLNLRRILSTGGKITIIMLNSGEILSSPIPKSMVEEPGEIEIEFVNNIYDIQKTFDQEIIFPEDGWFSVRDFLEARRLIDILQKGSTSYEGTHFNVDLKKNDVVLLDNSFNESEPVRFRIEWEDYSIKILSSVVNTGYMTQYLAGDWLMTKQEINKWLQEATEEDCLVVVLDNIKVKEEYLDWKQNGDS